MSKNHGLDWYGSPHLPDVQIGAAELKGPRAVIADGQYESALAILDRWIALFEQTKPEEPYTDDAHEGGFVQ